VSDLYSPSPVFKYNMFSLAALSLLLSFLPDKYSFFVFRALCGISAAALVPSAFRLIVAIFEPHELGRAFTLYGMSGALGNVLGLELAGVFSLIPGQGQMAAWRWFFRGVAVVVFPVALVCLKLVPTPKGAANESGAKWKRLDMLGAMS
jgi:MFS family permease